MSRAALLCLTCTIASCAETGQERVSIPLFVAGTDISEPTSATGDVPVVIERADLAFGPLYLCAGTQAGHFCETARLEWLDSVVIETTTPEPRRAGELIGVTGGVRSWMYDLGISSQLTQPEPVVLSAADALGGVSLVLEGHADVDGIQLPFSIALPIRQEAETELGVPVIHKRTDLAFFHEVTTEEPGLLIRFDPRPWIAGVDFRVHAEDADCSPDGPELVCARHTELTCLPDGTVDVSTDCEALGQICLAGIGCADRLVLERGSLEYRTVRSALLSSSPTFVWGFAR